MAKKWEALLVGDRLAHPPLECPSQATPGISHSWEDVEACIHEPERRYEKLGRLADELLANPVRSGRKQPQRVSVRVVQSSAFQIMLFFGSRFRLWGSFLGCFPVLGSGRLRVEAGSLNSFI